MPRPTSSALIAAAVTAATLAAGAGPAAAAPESSLPGRLATPLRAAGSFSGAYVVNATSGKVVFRRRHTTARILASNTKLFSGAAYLAELGPEGRLDTEVRGDGTLGIDGVYTGNLYLVGRGDPTFGSRRFGKRAYNGAASVEDLAKKLDALGIQRVTGRVYGDESRLDARRGTAQYRFRPALDIGGPLSGLAYNRGLATEGGSGFQANPPAFAAAKLGSALKARGIRVAGTPKAKTTPSTAQILVSVSSPNAARLLRLTLKPSDNYLAEMLLKDVGAEAAGKGTTRSGARAAVGFAKRLGSRVRLADGSGLSRSDRASPQNVARLLLAMRKRADFQAWFDALTIAGKDGTLAPRMRSGPARRRCRGKTGTLSNVSTLSGYCTARSGDVYAFSILMNGVNPFSARKLQDRMAQAIAGVSR
jgi:D-alanyl-D-alanine carboxypeptidase/D-alanyl-D-alanine-endopeptidase (penicillin-binding protein 4)